MDTNITYWLKRLIFLVLILVQVGNIYGADRVLTGTEITSVESAQGREIVKSWRVVKHLDPKIHLNPNILGRISSIRAGGKIPVDKFEDALNKQFGQILNSADEINANKILDRLQEAHVSEKHFDALVERLENPKYINTLVKDLKTKPEWFETFDDIVHYPDKYWEMISEGNIVSGSPLSKWGQGHWWKNLRTLAKDFEDIAALERVEELFGTAFGAGITIRVTNKKLNKTLDIIPDFLAVKNNKVHLLDAKYTTKDIFKVEGALTPNQTDVFDWIKGSDDLIIEVRAANDKLKNIPGIIQGSKLSKPDLQIDILKSGKSDNSFVESVINIY